MNNIIPKKFVNLHGHTTVGSIGDAIGTPQDHIDWSIKNGSDALAITDHGNMNAFSHQYLHTKKLIEKGIIHKPIFGVESYYVHSLSAWNVLKETINKQKLEEKQKKAAGEESLLEDIGDELVTTKKELSKIADENEDISGTILENEEESKGSNNKQKNPLLKRNHLVLLAKNSDGLKSLFKLVSKSFIDGFYMYPRIDLDMLRQEAKGNIIALSACVAGPLSRIIFDNQEPGSDWSKWQPNDYNLEKIQTELKSSIEAFKDALGEENFYLELQFNALTQQALSNYHLIEAAKRTNTPLVVTCDAHYANPEHWREREIYKLMAWSTKAKSNIEEDFKKIPQKIDELKCELYPKNVEQIWESYKRYSQIYGFYNDDKLISDAIERTWDIAHVQIEKEIEPDRSVKLPTVKRLMSNNCIEDAIEQLTEKNKEITEDDIAFEELKRLAKAGLLRRNKDDNKEYIERLIYELKVVKELSFQKYFLTYAKIMEILGKNLLTGPSRGSAAGSLLSYCLDITQIDPIKHGLLFERFLTKHKKNSYPDIDSDISDRDKAIELIAEHFGHDNVISVSNFNQLQLRSLIKDVARISGVPFEEINKYTGKIEQEALAEAKRTTSGFDRAQWVLTYDNAVNDSQTFRDLMTKYPDFEKTVRILFKQMKAISRHAGGVCISDNPSNNMPIIKSGGVLQTPWPEGLNARHLETLGFLKFDILGLGTLRMFEECIRKILQKKTGRKYISFDTIKAWYYQNLHPDNNPMDDINVYKNVYWESRFAGIFQFVSHNVQKFIAEMKPTSINDLAICTSIFRPAPLALGADKLYLQNRKNPKEILYKHPLLKEVMQETCNCLIYQEQLQFIYHKLAGVPLDETDNVRKAFTKKDLSNKEKAEKEIKRLRSEFVIKCKEVNGIEENISRDIFDDLDACAAYLFNKSHAISYATISYMCAQLLTYYPNEWIATYIDYCASEKGKQSGKEDPRSVALAEAQSIGYDIGKPDINLSEREYTVKNNKTLVPSFTSLKHVGTSVLKEIEEFRPYKTLEDLMWSKTIAGDLWRHSKFNKRALETLIRLEALDSMELVGPDKQFANYRQLYYVLVEKHDDLKRAISLKKKKTHIEDIKRYIEEARQLSDWSLEEKIQASVELSGTVDLGLIVTPEIRAYFRQESIPSIDNWEDDKQFVWCVVKNSTIAKTKTGRSYLRMKLYGESGATKQCFCWNFNEAKGDKVIPENSLIVGRFKSSDFGFSAYYAGIDVITSK